jgi:hypothetical protein
MLVEAEGKLKVTANKVNITDIVSNEEQGTKP